MKPTGPVRRTVLSRPTRMRSRRSKPIEMVDMGVRDEDVLEAVDFARRQAGYVAEVEHERVPLEQSLDIERRIAGSPVDQKGMQERPHAALIPQPNAPPGRNALPLQKGE